VVGSLPGPRGLKSVWSRSWPPEARNAMQSGRVYEPPDELALLASASVASNRRVGPLRARLTSLRYSLPLRGLRIVRNSPGGALTETRAGY